MTTKTTCKKMITLLFLITVLTTSISCNPNLTGPYEDPPGRRDYVWIVDTLCIPFSLLQSIWGSSSTNLWAVGPGGDLDKTIFHYDGYEWYSDGIARNLSPLGIWGTGSTSIWISAMEGKIWHFNGSSWIQDTVFNISDFIYMSFIDIWGDEATNIYTVGYAEDMNHKFIGILFHYNGLSWSKINVREESCSFLKIRKRNSGLEYFILGVTQDKMLPDTFKIFEYSNKKLTHIYSGTGDEKEFPYFERIGDDILFVIGMNVYKYNNNKFEKYFELNQNTNHAVSGRNIKDVFLGLQNGIAHFNGSNIEIIYEFTNSNVRIIDEIIFEKDVFFLTYDFSKNIHLIIRGHLN